MLRPCFSVNTGEMFTLQQTLSHAVSNIFFFSQLFKAPVPFYCKTRGGGKLKLNYNETLPR